MKYLIDRLEEGFAVLQNEDGSFVSVESSLIPSNAKEGDVLIFTSNSYFVDKEETKIRKNNFFQKFSSLKTKKTDN